MNVSAIFANLNHLNQQIVSIDDIAVVNEDTKELDNEWYVIDKTDVDEVASDEKIWQKIELTRKKVDDYYEYIVNIKNGLPDKFFGLFAEGKYGDISEETARGQFHQLVNQHSEKALAFFIEIGALDDITRYMGRFRLAHVFELIGNLSDIYYYSNEIPKIYFGSIEGKLSVTISDNKPSVSLEPIQITLETDDGRRYLSRRYIYLRDIPMSIQEQTPVYEIIQRPQEFIGKTVRINGWWIQRQNSTENFILPSIAHDYLDEVEKLSLQVLSEKWQQKLCNIVLESIPSVIERYEEVEVIGRIVETSTFPSELAITDIAEAINASSVGIYHWYF